MKRSFVALALVLVTAAGCATASPQGPYGQPTAQGPYGPPAQVPYASPPGTYIGPYGVPRHDFEGVIRYRGREGAPPGEPFDLTMVIRGDQLRSDLYENGAFKGAAGYDGPTRTLCVQLPTMRTWIPINLATVGWLFTMLPESVRKKSAKTTQDAYRWTGRTDAVLGRPCREMEDRGEKGELGYDCWSTQEYFGGDAGLIPILKQMGLDDLFLSSFTQAGIGWKGVDYDEKGVPKRIYEAVSIEPQSIAPQTFAGLCR